MLKIVGTQNGRIFLGGKDGCLYELYYQVKICHMNESLRTSLTDYSGWWWLVFKTMQENQPFQNHLVFFCPLHIQVSQNNSLSFSFSLFLPLSLSLCA